MKVIYEEPSAYADLVQTADNRVGLLFGKGDYIDLSPHIGTFQGLVQGTISLWMKTTQSGDMADLTESVALFQLEGTWTPKFHGRTCYVVQRLSGEIGRLVATENGYLLRLAENGRGVATVPGFIEGDADGDGVVGSGDLDLVRANWGRVFATAAAIPEPDKGFLLAAAFFGALFRFPRRK